MNRISLKRALLAAFLAVLAATPLLASPRVKIDSGALEGATSDGVTAFLGVPFAAPPVGPLRWRAPQPVEAWSGVRPATAFGPDCMQRPLDYVPGPGYIRPVSEDCLYLNIWRPAGAAARPLAVMVWIYGGAFTMGSGAWPAYNGANLARQGVIVVTINYRLGRFGFFAHPALSREDADGVLADYGLMDQMAALKWVRRNIAAFGGDPDNVTIFGESAGAFSVNALIASPMGRGLFDKAISESGGGQKGLGTLPDRYLSSGGANSAEALGAAWARSVGVGDDDLRGLRALPADVVLGPQSPRVSASFIIDGKILPKPVDEIFLDGGQARVPYIVGANAYEQSLLQWLPGAAEQGLDAMGPFRAEAIRLYGGNGAIDAKSAAGTLWGDAFMVAPARFLARRMAAVSAPAWLYHYSYVPKASRGRLPGAGHSAEISLVFHNERTAPYFAEAAVDSPMAEIISGYWVRFAKTGDPNGPSQVFWPRYDPASDRLLEFTDDGPRVETAFEKQRMDFLDRAYLSRAGLVEK